jgi:hypothetical protein
VAAGEACCSVDMKLSPFSHLCVCDGLLYMFNARTVELSLLLTNKK